jgi:predicted MFS family arabinose efflux permease
MSTLTCTEPRRGTSRDGTPGSTGTLGERLVSGPLALIFLAEFCALTSFYLLLSVTPGYAAAVGAGSEGAGLVTGVLLLGTVAAELAAPMLMRRYAHRTLLTVGALLLGVPALALLPRGSLVIMVTVSVVRGFGFGLSTVISGALTAALLPPQRRGEGLGLFGVVATMPGVIALPAGVWLAGQYGIAMVVGMATAAALIPLAAFGWLPGSAHSRTDPGPSGLLTGLRQRGQLRLFVIFAASTMAGGVVVSFLPLAAGVSGAVAAVGLLAQALTATISRWWAGRQGDRVGHARLLVPALIIASLGMITMIWLIFPSAPSAPAAVIVGMCLFGTGFGISQNATFALMIDRMAASGSSGPGTASALWNLAYDAGYGAGPIIFGLFVSQTGYPAAFALTGVLMLAVLPIARREHPPVASPGAQGAGG